MKILKKRKLAIITMLFSLIAAFSQKAKTDANSVNLAENAMKALFKNYDKKEVKLYLKENYIQHNPNVPTGREAIIGFLPVLKNSKTTYETHRIFKDGNFVVLHNTYKNAQPFGAEEIVAFDIWRLEDGKIAEHWDAVSPKVEKTVNGRTQVDGETKVDDLSETHKNKQLIKKLINDVFIKGKSNTITNYISTEQYDQHNPLVKDGLSGLSEAITYLTSQNNMFKYHKIHKILGQGNFVLAVVEGEWNQKPYVFYDLFRIKHGKVVEHWDVVNEIPEKMAHDNGLFNF